MSDEDSNDAGLDRNEPVLANLPIQRIEARSKVNPRWSTRFNNKLLTVPIRPLFTDRDVVFTMGSCFAERIRIALAEQGLRVGPPLRSIPRSPDNYIIDRLPQREHMNY